MCCAISSCTAMAYFGCDIVEAYISVHWNASQDFAALDAMQEQYQHERQRRHGRDCAPHDHQQRFSEMNGGLKPVGIVEDPSWCQHRPVRAPSDDPVQAVCQQQALRQRPALAPVRLPAVDQHAAVGLQPLEADHDGPQGGAQWQSAAHRVVGNAAHHAGDVWAAHYDPTSHVGSEGNADGLDGAGDVEPPEIPAAGVDEPGEDLGGSGPTLVDVDTTTGGIQLHRRACLACVRFFGSIASEGSYGSPCRATQCSRLLLVELLLSERGDLYH